jgi:hypothetical protein
MTDQAQSQDLADPAVPTSPEESAMLDSFRSQDFDQNARPDASVSQDLADAASKAARPTGDV